MVLAAQYLISEFMASNTAGILDQDNQLHDWIEVQNVGDSAGNLQGYYLTDNRNDLQNWDFPSVPVAAGGFVRVFASGKDRAVAGQELHTDFGLEKNGGYLALVAPNGSTIVHKYDEYPDQLDNISYGVLSQASTDTPGYQRREREVACAR